MASNEKPSVLLEDKSLEENSGDDEDDEVRDEHQKPLIDGDSNASENVIPLSIGKIKIFKPRRRNRFLLKKYFKMCSFISVVIFIAIYLYRLKDSFYLSDISYIPNKARCDRLSSSVVWNSTFPMLTIESALRLVDVDNDTILDVIVPFGTGIDASYYDSTSCQIYFNQSKDDISGCGGGVMAVNGATGRQMWVRYTPHELFASNCNLDINGDKIKDCILGGRMATLYAIDGSNGELIWQISPTMGEPIVETSNFYTPLYVPRDVDNDGVPELVVIHGGDPLRKPNERARIAGRILIISAKTGTILSWSLVLDGSESYYSPQLLLHPDGSLLILYGTGGETHGGGFYAILFDDLFNKRIQKSRLIYKDCCKGIMVPPVLIDLNDDDVLDIVMSLFNSTVIAFDGLQFKELWRSEFPNSETYSTPAIGYFNNDTTPDFAVLYQKGPGFPVYYSAQFTVLDGKNGRQILDKPIDMLIGTQSSPLTISTTAKNDIFLYWYSTCQDHQQDTNLTDQSAQPFKLAPGTTVHDNSRADFCKLRFNTSLFTQLRAQSPDNYTILYDSREHPILNTTNYTAFGIQWIQENLVTNEFFENKAQDSDADQQPYRSSFREFEEKHGQQFPDIYSNSYDNRPISPVGYGGIFKPRRRYRRHVGVHDGGGIQRVISTGTLASALSTESESIDLVFATFWFPAAKKVRLMSPEVEECIARYMDPREESRLRLENSNSYFKRLKFDHDSYEEAVREICSDHDSKPLRSQTDSIYSDLVRDMGELTLYRLNMKCVSDVKHAKPAAIKDLGHQWWPSYMGADADSIVNVNDVSVEFKQ